jgi:uncharacterized membrane protein YphA (DoxX/SURF4 family)
MTQFIEPLVWGCQFYLAFLFYRSAYRKVTGYARVTDEFQRWGYPFPGLVTFFLICVWILCATAQLFPTWSAPSAIVLLVFMIAAFTTLVIHREFKRLVEPARPIALSAFIIYARSNELIDIFELLRG